MSITDKEIAMRILFSKRLGDLIEKHGIQQNDLAIRIGVSESTVGKWLLKKAMPRMGTIQKLSDYFSVPKSYFLEESPAAPQEAPAASASFEYTLIPVGISAGQMEDCEALSLLPKISVPDVIMGPYARDPHVVFMRVNGESMNRVIDNGATIAVMTLPPHPHLLRHPRRPPHLRPCGHVFRDFVTYSLSFLELLSDGAKRCFHVSKNGSFWKHNTFSFPKNGVFANIKFSVFNFPCFSKHQRTQILWTLYL